MMVNMAERFAGKFRRRVRRDRIEDRVLLPERHLLVHAVHAGRRGEYEPLHAELPCQLEQVLCPDNIDSCVELGLRERRTDPGTRGEMNNGIKGLRRKHPTEIVADVSFDQCRLARKCTNVVAFQRWIIKVIKVVDKGNCIAPS